jgi:hypothetical protein
MYLSRQSIRLCPSTRRLDDGAPPAIAELVLEVLRVLSTERLHAAWIVIPLILAAAVPEVAVTSKRCSMPLHEQIDNHFYNPRLSRAAFSSDKLTQLGYLGRIHALDLVGGI